jgi:hypothetical protein
MNAFDISDDLMFRVSYVRIVNDLTYVAQNSETRDNLQMATTAWVLQRAGSTIGTGTFSITPAPEPRSLFLLMPIVALVGLRWRYQRHRA